MFGKNRKKKVGLCVMVVTACLVLAALWAVLAIPETALAVKPDKPPKPPKDGGGERTAMVTISGPITEDGVVLPGPMPSAGPHSFGLGETNQTLGLNSWTGDDRGAPVPISYNFVHTSNCEGDLVLKAHLDDSVTVIDFPYRWSVKIVVDMSSLDGVGSQSTTNKKGGHSINITTNPDDYRASTPTITETVETLWIPEGPNKSGLVTVKWVSDTGSDSNPRTRVFEFTPPFKIQVWTGTGGEHQMMRCDNLNLDDAIVVTVVTTP